MLQNESTWQYSFYPILIFIGADCIDKGADCHTFTAENCEKLGELKTVCPLSCGVCTCDDDCGFYDPSLCKFSTELQEKCPKSCGLCTPRE